MEAMPPLGAMPMNPTRPPLKQGMFFEHARIVVRGIATAIFALGGSKDSTVSRTDLIRPRMSFVFLADEELR